MKYVILTSFFVATLFYNFELVEDTGRRKIQLEPITICVEEKACVFRTLFGEESSDSSYYLNTPQNVVGSVDKGLSWLVNAQLKNGGWGAGTHSRQDMLDPHAVDADPATTAMSLMALMRNRLHQQHGTFKEAIHRGTEFLLDAVENTPDDQLKITALQGTQIQQKLGQHIDAILTAQCFTNMLFYFPEHPQQERIKSALNSCVTKIQQAQQSDGSVSGAGWAGVLQSSLANNALETAEKAGASVDQDLLKKSRDYQKSNFNPANGEVLTGRSAGVVLYSVTGSARASAKQARKMREIKSKAKEEGRLNDEAELSEVILQDMGYSKEESKEYVESYNVYQSSKNVAQEEKVMNGFGNNGGEEFISYLQTGESLIINQDPEWKQWYENISGRLVSIQNENGSWNGHHCITSPVFCTATTLLTLSINNDIDMLGTIGE